MTGVVYCDDSNWLIVDRERWTSIYLVSYRGTFQKFTYTYSKALVSDLRLSSTFRNSQWANYFSI